MKLVFGILTCCVLHIKCELTESEKEDVLVQHNKWRRAEGAAGMRKMTYDDALAKQADLWTKECIFEHGFPVVDGLPYGDSVGQNIWVGTSANSFVANAVLAWFNEKPYYDFESNTCEEGKVCGHYTQVVWDESHLVGCAVQQCETMKSLDLTNAYIFVCNYAPGGNMVSFRPYKKGDQCSDCPGYNAECDDGLCYECSEYGGSCSCNLSCDNCGVKGESCRCNCPTGWGGQSCKVACENFHEYCGDGWYSESCSDWYVRASCPATCGLCEIGVQSGEKCESNEYDTTMGQDDPDLDNSAVCFAPFTSVSIGVLSIITAVLLAL